MQVAVLNKELAYMLGIIVLMMLVPIVIPFIIAAVRLIYKKRPTKYVCSYHAMSVKVGQIALLDTERCTECKKRISC